ncbi:type VI secretion system protein TssA [Shimia sagamensis]|uniref:Type VI secretion system protein ImpA n=1 Tax=Shimia sagamensis TaxID=1566352 RepID=A0ABY1PI77_9RHOB|nr:type VI secretion system protein TssA [Shimia sagamensis]SMP34743.1 type VI secretion system protein ImpA [Shimia sagamensis]
MDISSLLGPLEGDSPSGIELRNESEFHSLERMVQPAGREHRLNDDGTINPKTPDVDWTVVATDASALAKKGRDLRLLVIFVRALYAQDGFAGLVSGLGLLSDTLDQHWATLHPALRARDDPTMASLPRANALRQLENDNNGLLGDLKFDVVLNPRGIGAIMGDDLAKASLSNYDMLSRAAAGLNQSEKDALSASHETLVNRVNAACRQFADQDAETAAKLVADIATCETATAALVATFANTSGVPDGTGLNLSELAEYLAQIKTTLESAIAVIGDGSAQAEDGTSAGTPEQLNGSASMVQSTAASGTEGGAVNSREDVETALDQIVAFYERTEPSSPIPHLARRMRRMVAMDFLELIEEIAPSGLKEFRNIAGVEDQRAK